MKILKMATIALLLAVTVSSCKSEDESTKEKICDVKNPLTDLLWLKEIIDERIQNRSPYMSISKCSYNENKEGFLIESCVNCDDYQVYLSNCEGIILFDLHGIQDRNIYFEDWNIKDIRVIWKNY